MTYTLCCTHSSAMYSRSDCAKTFPAGESGDGSCTARHYTIAKVASCLRNMRSHPYALLASASGTCSWEALGCVDAAGQLGYQMCIP